MASFLCRSTSSHQGELPPFQRWNGPMGCCKEDEIVILEEFLAGETLRNFVVKTFR